MRTSINFVKSKNKSRGFTLIEMCISMLIIGLLIAPVVTAYNIYEQNRKIEKTASALDRAATNLEGYLAAFGRYPCPASLTVAPGDVGYGLEARDASGNCEFAPAVPGIIQTTNTAAATPNQDVLIGALPFKTLNLQEDDTYDGYMMRLTYAVSDIQTDSTTFQSGGGRIDIHKLRDSDNTPVSMLSNPNTADYVVVSYGRQNAGGYSLHGVLVDNCTNALTLDQENCDNDAIFMFTELSNMGDDQIAYTGGKSNTPWQYQEGETDDIHLKINNEKVVSGDSSLFSQVGLAGGPSMVVLDEGRDAQIAADCSWTPFTNICLEFVDNSTVLMPSGLTARQICESNLNAPECRSGWSFGLASPGVLAMPAQSDGLLLVENQKDVFGVEIPNSGGGVIVEQICDNGGANCFNPRLIGGQHNTAPGALPAGGALNTPFSGTRFGGVSALGVNGEGGNMACPDGEIMVGINSGQIVCTDNIKFNCPPGQHLAGVSATGELECSVPALPSCPVQAITNTCGENVNLPNAPDGTMQPMFSGTCYKINSFNAAAVAGFTTLAQFQTYVNQLNTEAVGGSRSIVDCDLTRDRYDCSAGTWSAKLRTHELGNFGASFPSITSASNAEYTDGAYPAGAPMSVDPNNSTSNHDCWCREDYRARQRSCSTGTGNVFEIWRYRCPATTISGSFPTNWVKVWDSGTSGCSCTPGTGVDDLGACSGHISGSFDPTGVTGNVYRPYSRNAACVKTYTGPKDYSACSCPPPASKAPQKPASSVACLPDQLNSWGFESVPYTNTASVVHKYWVCPTVTGQLDTAAEVGGYLDVRNASQTCNCDNGKLGFRTESCPPDELGSRKIETKLDCSLGPPAYVDTTAPPTVLQNCQGCQWKRPTSGTPREEAGQVGKKLDSKCNCNTDTVSQCWVPNGTKYDVYTGCTCEPT